MRLGPVPMTETFSASCFVADAPGSQPCTVAVEGRWLAIRPAAGPTVRWPYGAIVGEIMGDERTLIALSCPRPLDEGVTTVVIREPALVAKVAARLDEPCRGVFEGLAAGTHRHASRHRRRLIFALVGLAAAVVLGWTSCMRLVPELAAVAMPVATEVKLGRVLVEGVLAGERRIDDGPARDAVRRIVERLAAASDNPGYTFDVHVIDDRRVNALAVPGGQIVVFTGLLAAAESAEEVAGVLAHEMQHVLHRHGLKQLVRQLGSAAVISLATGGGNLAGLAGRFDELAGLSYGREQEAEADRDGLALLHRAGLPAEGMQAFFERLQKQQPGGVPEFLSTHPDTPRRIEELRRRAAALPPSKPVTLGIDWDGVRKSLVQER